MRWYFASLVGPASIAALAAIAIGVVPLPARAQPSFTVTNLVNSSQSRPDAPLPWYVFTPPALDGSRAVFLTKNAQVFATLDGIWTIDVTTGVPTKLAGLATPMPGGSGNFGGFGLFFASDDPSPTIGGGVVAFYGYDTSGLHGLFTVPAAGGTITPIVIIGDAAPDGGTFSYFARASVNARTVTFYGETTGAASHRGIFKASVTGHHVMKVIDDTTNLDAEGYGGGAGYYGLYTSPVIGRKDIAFYATGIGDPSTYPNAIFQTGGGGFNRIADNLSALPGDTNPSPHVQITGYSAAIGSNSVAFLAHDGGYGGIFRAGGANPAFVTYASTAPGTASGFSNLYSPSYDTTGLGFGGTDAATNHQNVYFVAGPGKKIALIASGATYNAPTIGNRAVSQGRVVFFDGNIFFNGIYVAAPAP